MRKMRLVLIAILGLTPGLAYGQVMIDSFALPVQPTGGTDYLMVGGAMGSAASLVQGGVDAIAGTRVYYAQKTNTDPSAVMVGINDNQMYRQILPAVVAGRSKLLYGYSAVSTPALSVDDYTTGHTFNNLNLNVSLSPALVLDYALGGNAAVGMLVVTVISGREGAVQQASVSLPIVPTAHATLNFTQAAFLASNPSINFGDIDQIVVSLNGVTPGVNAAIDDIRFAAIPEPTSLALVGFFGTGGVFCFYFRRRFGERKKSQKEYSNAETELAL
jgi:hypothetical protein